MTIKQLLIAGLCCVTPSLIAQTGKIKLSEMDLSSIYQPYGTTPSAKSVPATCKGSPVTALPDAGVPYG